MRVAVVHNAVDAGGGPDEQDVRVQVEAVCRALDRMGHDGVAFSCTLDLADIERRLRRFAPERVFNLVEAVGGHDRLVHLFPSLLEALELRYSGSAAETVLATTCKVMAKQRMAAMGLPTPEWQGPRPASLYSALALDDERIAESAWIRKSVWNHASLGLDRSALVRPRTRAALLAGLERRVARQGGLWFAERFIDGREFNLSLLAAEDHRHQVQGFALLLHEPRIRFTFLDWLATASGRTGGGIGGALYDRVRWESSSLQVKGLFFESLPDDRTVCPDARLLKENRGRLRFYENYGARPVVGSAYELPLRPGADCMPHLIYDGLDDAAPLRRAFVRKVVRAVLERKYGDLCPPAYVARVVASFKDDPVRLRDYRYVTPGTVQAAVADRFAEPIALVVNERHTIHHVHERGYVESPVRMRSILASLEKSGLFAQVRPRSFADRHILTVHEPDFVGYLKRACADAPEGKSLYPYVFPIRNQTRPPRERSVLAGYYCIDTFTPLNRNAYPAARRAVDCALTAAREVLDGRRIAYALVRPPGHHAERRAFGGFCYFNGFADERGEAEGQGCNLNLPLAETVDGRTYRKALRSAIRRIEAFDPRFLVVALGLDTAKSDPTGTWRLTARDFEHNGRLIGAAGVPAVVVQEGGYRTRTLGDNALAFFRGMAAGARQWRPPRQPPERPIEGGVWRDAVVPGDRERIRRLVDKTGMFSSSEIDVAAELVSERLGKGPGSGYSFLLAEDPGGLRGYTCFGPIACTAASYDVYWIAVNPEHQGRGLGRALLAETERRIQAAGGRRIYVETSQRGQYAGTRLFYNAAGYRQEAVLVDFYGPGDAKVIFCKRLG